MSRTAIRWVAPFAAAALAIGGGLVATTASAEPALPKKTAEQLLTDVAGARVDGLSGTVRETAELGLPSLPSGEHREPSDFSSLLTGTHTLKVWTSGEDKSRVALLGTYGESDLIRNGTQAWLWSSEDKTVLHATYTGDTSGGPGEDDPADVPATPQQAARKVLAAIDPSTETSVARNVTVAGRPAYELVLTPKDDRTLVHEVAIAIDATTSVPLRVQVTADGQSDPAFSVGFTDVDFSVPAAHNFSFTPPKGATVKEKTISGDDHGEHDDADHRATKDEAPGRIVGDGWTSVLVADHVGDLGDLTGPGSEPGSESSPELGQLLQSLPKVSGSWGSGRLLTGALFSAVITDDGRVAVGAVKPALLYDALAR